MYLSKTAPKNRLREAENARRNRAEIVRALSVGEVTRRDLLRMGIFTAAGMLALKNGLSPFADSAYGAIPTGTPRSPLSGAKPFTQPMPRLNLQTPCALDPLSIDGGHTEVRFRDLPGEHTGRGRSWHDEFNAARDAGGPNPYLNPVTGRGPCEGRPWGPYFAHQRWQEYIPTEGYLMTLGQVESGVSFHPKIPDQAPNSVWSYGPGGLYTNGQVTRGTLPPPLLKVRYGDPVLVRIYNGLPVDRAENNGFGRNEVSTHNHNAHNGAASDGANNAYFFPGQFYDYLWSTTLARADRINTSAIDPRASGIDADGNLRLIKGDFRELQGSLWFHDHRFFFTAENVYKGNAGMMNYYSGPDRGFEGDDAKGKYGTQQVNLRLPSGTLLPWGNIDFDVNLMISDFALGQDGQLFFDIFDTDGFLGDNLLVNFAYAPFFEVVRRKYRFRILNACMSRFIKLALINEAGKVVPVKVIANDGNFLVNPVTVNQLERQGSAERFDIIVDFSPFKIGDKLTLINLVEHEDGRGPKEDLSLKDAIRKKTDDPAVGPLLEFRIVRTVQSVDDPSHTYRDGSLQDLSQVPGVLTEQIPIVQPVRTREIEFKRGENEPFEGCLPDCDEREFMPWTIRINGESQHYMNANRASLVVPRPGEVEHWILKNGGGGWDHPVHLHFEEGVTISRTVGDRNSPLQIMARKDVWRLGEGGSVKIQVQFSEYGGAYVMHCHNTVHEDFAMLMRYDVLRDNDGTEGNVFYELAKTPNPTPDGVEFLDPEILREGDPRRRSRGSSA